MVVVMKTSAGPYCVTNAHAVGAERGAGQADAHDGRCFDLRLCADRRGRTFIGAQFVRYPVHICRPLYGLGEHPEVCTLTLQSVSGGLFEHERVHGRLVATAGACAVVGTSASTIVHAMEGGRAEQLVELQVEAGAALAYLPEPAILFPGSRLRSRIQASVAPGGVLLLGDSVLAHDPAGQGRGFAELDTQLEVRGTDGRLLVRDRFCTQGQAWLAQQAGLSGPFAVHASLWLIREGDPTALLAQVRQVLATLSPDGAAATVHAGASDLPNRAGVQVRLLCTDAVALRRTLAELQAVLCAPLCIPLSVPHAPDAQASGLERSAFFVTHRLKDRA